LRVAEAMKTNVAITEEAASVVEASLNIGKKGEGCAIVLREGKPLGIVTEHDVTVKVVAKGLDPKSVKIVEIMSTPLIIVDPDADLLEAAKIMKQHNIWRLAVVREGTLRGVVTAADIARNLESYLDNEVRDALRYLARSPTPPGEG
jgi:CBS domain-containing protein